VASGLAASGHRKKSTNDEFFAAFLARHPDKSSDGEFSVAFQITHLGGGPLL
jgi:hypothetical protein